MPAPTPARISIPEALVLGLLHGPAELAPVSSSGHLTAVPYLGGFAYAELDADLRKAFEVALHAGTYLALIIGLRAEVAETLRTTSPRSLAFLVTAFLPPAVIGLGLEGPIERRLGTPTSVAVGLIGGGALLAWADTAPQAREAATATLADAAWLGVAQASALMPGVSRNGATLTAGRLRGFRRVDANRLSRQVALPVIGAATGLKVVRLARRGLPPGALAPFGVGALASFVSTLASLGVLDVVERDASFAPFAAYRIGLGGAVLARSRRVRSPGRSRTMDR
ncbi:MAG TPA: undecaprenyl-diphosphate phosphatase [Solirubrobacteraceae bacterium]|nr:undecaprenyl-diphosphate phosphatase [Solirubrobacteraceae bacterium]